MKSFTTLIIVLIASLALVTAEMVRPLIMNVCDLCTAPDCTTSGYLTKLTLQEAQNLGGTRTFHAMTGNNGQAKVIATFLNSTRYSQSPSGPGRITNGYQEDIVVEIDVKALIIDEDKEHYSMKHDTLVIKIKAGSTCSTPLPKGYEIKDVMQVTALTNESE
jgi:hypothetical protein